MYVCTCVSVSMYLCASASMLLYNYVPLRPNLSASVHQCVGVFVFVCASANACMCVGVHACVFGYLCMHAWLDVRIYMSTHLRIFLYVHRCIVASMFLCIFVPASRRVYVPTCLCNCAPTHNKHKGMTVWAYEETNQYHNKVNGMESQAFD